MDLLEALQDSRPHLLILDLRMPGMDGFQLLDRIREAGVRAPAILLTAQSDALGEALRRGFDRVLGKEFREDEFVETIRAVVKQHKLDILARAFLAIPFHPEFSLVADALRIAAAQCSIEIIRGDDPTGADEIFQSVRGMIDTCDFVIADVSPHLGSACNPNVAIEVGYALGKGKTLALLSREVARAPFDLRHLRIHAYDPAIDEPRLAADFLGWLKELNLAAGR
ncbi:MAG: response regulator [Planctomycetes bacterium]|nr:response regulator [Planctomycetota bacterium]